MDITIPAYESFLPLVDSVFEVPSASGGATGTLLLISVQPLDGGGRPPELGRPFELVFRAPGTTLQPQGMVRLRHPAMGEFILFLVPIGREAEHIDYAVTVN